MSNNFERRRNYRASNAKDAGLEAYVLHGQRPVRVELLDTSFAGAAFAPPEWLSFPLKQAITMQFASTHLPLPIAVDATIRSRVPRDELIRYGAAFTNPGALHLKLPTRLLGSFNRRRTFRVSPPTSEPITATVGQVQRTRAMQLPMICVSVTGCALFARQANERTLTAGERVDVQFAVPGTRSVCRLKAMVRYGVKSRAGTRYGLEFDGANSPVFERQETILSRYVMEQQRRILAA